MARYYENNSKRHPLGIRIYRYCSDAAVETVPVCAMVSWPTARCRGCVVHYPFTGGVSVAAGQCPRQWLLDCHRRLGSVRSIIGLIPVREVSAENLSIAGLGYASLPD